MLDVGDTHMEGSIILLYIFSIHLKSFIITKIGIHFIRKYTLKIAWSWVFLGKCISLFIWKRKMIRALSTVLVYVEVIKHCFKVGGRTRGLSCSSFSLVTFPNMACLPLLWLLKFLWPSWTLSYQLAYYIIDISI